MKGSPLHFFETEIIMKRAELQIFQLFPYQNRIHQYYLARFHHSRPSDIVQQKGLLYDQSPGLHSDSFSTGSMNRTTKTSKKAKT